MLFIKRLFSTTMRRTDTYHFDPSFVLERDRKIKLMDRFIVNLQEFSRDEMFYINYPINKNKELTNVSKIWENKINNEYWYSYTRKHYINNVNDRPHGVINYFLHKKKYYDVEEFKKNVDKLFYNLK
jgi:hypothetical protein